MEFEWDASKDTENLRKHKISFAEAVESFYDPAGFVVVDGRHSEIEQRFYWIGKGLVGSSPHHQVHPTRSQDTDNRLRGVEGIQEDVQ